MQNALTGAWWPQPSKMQPLEAVRVTAEHLERGAPVPKPAAMILAAALRKYLAGQTDITGNLGLRPRRGFANQSPLRIEAVNRRNAAICQIYEAQPGVKPTAKAELTALLLLNPPDPRITDAEVMAAINLLKVEFGNKLPKTGRQISNIVAQSQVVNKA